MKRPAGLVLLLLALLLPLQGFAFARGCDPAAPVKAEHCTGHPDGPAGGVHHHECGSCCVLATPTVSGLRLTGRTFSAALPPERPLTAHPTLLLDRLDRPPRP